MTTLEQIEEKKLQEMATKYHIGDHLKDPFFKEMVTLWVRIKEATGKDPHEWLKHYDTKTFENTGSIGWIDALNAIEAVAKAYIKLQAKDERTKHSF